MRQLVYIFVLCGFFSWESWGQSLTKQEQLLREGRRLEDFRRSHQCDGACFDECGKDRRGPFVFPKDASAG